MEGKGEKMENNNVKELNYLVTEGERLLKINIVKVPISQIREFREWRRRYDDWVLNEFTKECKMFGLFSKVNFTYLRGFATPNVTIIALKRSYQIGIKKAIWLLNYYKTKRDW